METAFELHNITKSYGSVHALQDVSLSAEQGTVFGLLGPNGAGKSTIVKILSTLQKSSSGNASVMGVDVDKDSQKVRKLIGLAGQYAAVDDFQTGYENTFMTAQLYGLNRAEANKKTVALLEKLSLSDAAHRQVGTYSGGMRRRLDLCSSLVGEPKMLFLDEPTTGLDPKTRADLWIVIKELVQAGTSILLTTQYLEEADVLADMIAVVDKGRVIASGTSDELKSRLSGGIVILHPKTMNLTEFSHMLSSSTDFKVSVDDDTQTVRVAVKDDAKDLMSIIETLKGHKIEVDKIETYKPSLDDVFLELTKANNTETTNEEQEK